MQSSWDLHFSQLKLILEFWPTELQIIGCCRSVCGNGLQWNRNLIQRLFMILTYTSSIVSSETWLYIVPVLQNSTSPEGPTQGDMAVGVSVNFITPNVNPLRQPKFTPYFVPERVMRQWACSMILSPTASRRMRKVAFLYISSIMKGMFSRDCEVNTKYGWGSLLNSNWHQDVSSKQDHHLSAWYVASFPTHAACWCKNII